MLGLTNIVVRRFMRLNDTSIAHQCRGNMVRIQCVIPIVNMTDNTLSGHSFRVGAAIDLLDKGIPIERIMLRGGWKSERTAMRYLRNWDDSDWVVL